MRPTALLAGIVASRFVVAAGSGLVEQVFDSSYVPLFYLLSLYAVGRQSREYLLRTLMGLQLETYSEPIRVFQKALFATLALTVAFFGYSVEGILITDIITSLVITIILIAILSRVFNYEHIISPPPVSVPKSSVYRYIGSTILFFGFLTSLYHIDILFLQQFVSEVTVGHYKGALVIAEILWLAPVAVQLALLQRVSTLWDDGDIEEIQRQAELVSRFTVLFTILAALGMAALAPDFVPLYLGEDFSPAVIPLILLLPGVVGFAAARPTLAINQARRSLRPLIVATGACALVNVLLNSILIPQYGMVGAAVATSFGYGSLVIFQSIAARHIGYAPFRGIMPIRTLLTGSIAAVPIFSLVWIIDSSLLSLIVVPPVGLSVFLVAAILTGVVQQKEIRLLLDQI